MKMTPLVARQRILAKLADGQFHSGEAIAKELSLSRTAVAGHIAQLSDWGLDVFKVKGKGYRLQAPLTLLSEAAIKQIIGRPLRAHVDVRPVVTSTNTLLKQQLPDVSDGDVLLAEIQTDGRGRHGRTWLAPVGGSLTFSMYWGFDGYQSMSGLSLLVGIAICRALSRFGIEDAELKWPNDVYLNGRKLAGVLIEVEGQIGAVAHSVIGIGLNVSVPSQTFDVGQPHIDLAERLGNEVDRNQLAAVIIATLWQLLPEFERRGFDPFVHEWRALDLFADRKVVMSIGDKRFVGIDRGVESTGALLVETEDGITRFHGGEVSLRGG